jgi:hypothetical protein
MARRTRLTPDRALALPQVLGFPPEPDTGVSVVTPVPAPRRGDASTFGHQIRNSLHRAMMQLMLLDREHERMQAGPNALAPAEALRGEILKISNVVNHYLDQRTRFDFAGAPLTLRAACARAVERVTADATARGIEIAAELGGEAAPGADLVPFEQTVLHVLRCAVESARADSKILIWSHGTGTDAALEVNWELVPDAVGSGTLETTLDCVSKRGCAVEVKTAADRARIHAILTLLATNDAKPQG